MLVTFIFYSIESIKKIDHLEISILESCSYTSAPWRLSCHRLARVRHRENKAVQTKAVQASRCHHLYPAWSRRTATKMVPRRFTFGSCWWSWGFGDAKERKWGYQSPGDAKERNWWNQSNQPPWDAKETKWWNHLRGCNGTLPSYTLQKLSRLNVVVRIHVRRPSDTDFCRSGTSQWRGRDGIFVEVCWWGIPLLHPHGYDCKNARKELLYLGHPTRTTPPRGISRSGQLEHLSSHKAKLFDALHVSHAESFDLGTSHSHSFWSGGYGADVPDGRYSMLPNSPYHVSVAWASNILQMLCLHDGSLDRSSARLDTLWALLLMPSLLIARLSPENVTFAVRL